MARTADTTITTDIAAHLEDDSVGTQYSSEDWGIFENTMPPKPDKCIAVFVYGGVPPDLSWDGEYPSIQVRVRGASHSGNTAADQAVHAATAAKAYDVSGSLHKTGLTTLNGVTYYWIAAKHSPSSLGRDAKGRDLYVVNFDVMKEYE